MPEEQYEAGRHEEREFGEQLELLGAEPGVTPFEAVEVQRLAEALDDLDGGTVPDIDPREDPEIASLLSTASQLHESLTEVTQSNAFESYRARSRAYVLHTLEADWAGRQQYAAPRDLRISVFGPRPNRTARRARWAVAGAIAAAAAALGTVFFTAGQASDHTDD